MIEPAGFRMIELLSRDDLAAHPVWADFHEERDRARILSWGVAPERLDAEIRRYDYCGRAPLYPVLDLADAGAVAHPSVALRLRLPDGRTLPGYRLGGGVVGFYAGDEEFCLNPSLPGRARTELERLATALGLEPRALRGVPYEVDAQLAGDLGAPGRIDTGDAG